MQTLPAPFLSQVDALLEHIKADYAAWSSPDPADPVAVKVRKEMVKRFNSGLRVERGSKYMKVVSHNSVHSFIVVKPDAKFKFGDILKAASWATPARNFARGNILTGDFKAVRWPGI